MITSSLNTAFTYMNLIEHWGSGIPRIIDKVKAAGLQEPEFIGGEVDLRINIINMYWKMALLLLLKSYCSCICRKIF